MELVQWDIESEIFKVWYSAHAWKLSLLFERGQLGAELDHWWRLVRDADLSVNDRLHLLGFNLVKVLKRHWLVYWFFTKFQSSWDVSEIVYIFLIVHSCVRFWNCPGDAFAHIDAVCLLLDDRSFLLEVEAPSLCLLLESSLAHRCEIVQKRGFRFLFYWLII